MYLIVNGMKMGFTAVPVWKIHMTRQPEKEKRESKDIHRYKAVYEDRFRSWRPNCDYLIVYDHEGKGDANGVESYQKEHAAAFLQAGADIVIGGHSDRLQGIEYIDGKPVVYSMGSVLTDGTSRYATVLKLQITSEGLKEMCDRSRNPDRRNDRVSEFCREAEKDV